MAGRALRRERKEKQPGGDFGAIPHEGIPASPIPTEDNAALAMDAGPKAVAMKGLDDAPPEAPAPPAVEASAGPAAKKVIADLVRRHANHKISAVAGESFNDSRMRVLPLVRSAMQELAHDPSQYIPIVTQAQTIKLIDAWMDAGMPDDFSVNPEAMRVQPEAPGAVERLYPVPEAPGWRKEAIQLDQPLPPPPGILLIRHGVADGARSSYEKMGSHQDALAQLAKQIKAGDFSRARALAHKASTEFGVSDEDISHIIDSSLPSPEEAAQLPHNRLLAVASAAHGSERFPQYADLLRERFSNLDGLPPDAQNQLRSHLGALGV